MALTAPDRTAPADPAQTFAVAAGASAGRRGALAEPGAPSLNTTTTTTAAAATATTTTTADDNNNNTNNHTTYNNILWQ